MRRETSPSFLLGQINCCLIEALSRFSLNNPRKVISLFPVPLGTDWWVNHIVSLDQPLLVSNQHFSTIQGHFNAPFCFQRIYGSVCGKVGELFPSFKNPVTPVGFCHTCIGPVNDEVAWDVAMPVCTGQTAQQKGTSTLKNVAQALGWQGMCTVCWLWPGGIHPFSPEMKGPFRHPYRTYNAVFPAVGVARNYKDIHNLSVIVVNMSVAGHPIRLGWAHFLAT